MLDRKIEFVKGVGSKIALKFQRLGIETIQDLLFYYPRRYEDYTKITPISKLQTQKFGIPIDQNTLSDRATIKGRILGIENKKTSRRRFTVTEAVVEDGTGSLKVIWFNQPFLKKMLSPDREVILNGKLTYNTFSYELVLESPNRAAKPMIVPIYGETEGFRSGYIANIFSRIKYNIDEIKEWLPETLLKDPLTIDHQSSTRLMPIGEALLNIHQPENSVKLKEAQRRLAFDELFLISLRANIVKESLKKEKAPIIKIEKSNRKIFLENLDFKLTGDQNKAIEQITADMSEDEPMNRLLNGDVGSGKTIVAAMAAYAAIKAGYKAVLMAPTSILANQHYETFCKLFEKLDISVGLVTSNRQEISQNAKTKGQYKGRKFAAGLPQNTDILIGTHALLHLKEPLENVGLVIVDEQHRFGVRQRGALLSWKSKADGARPHFLSMTATPIPRTLQLALFGDLDVSLIQEKPANRREIKTRFVEPQNRQKAYRFIQEHIRQGKQAFVVCPLIEEKDSPSIVFPAEEGILEDPREKPEDDNYNMASLFETDRKSVKSEYEKLKKIFPQFKIGMLHGKMKAKEKEAIMNEFCANKLNILVSTSVIEVGVDIPNATIMMIEDAERFGLAQLHQFRGRVGRGDHQSFCLLFSSTMVPKARKRLESMETISDGFRLAEIDLETRGAGAVFGTLQSGMLGLRMASLSDHILISQASEAAKAIARDDPELDELPLLKEKLSEYMSHKHLE